jgi:uncharacterized protein YkwD
MLSTRLQPRLLRAAAAHPRSRWGGLLAMAIALSAVATFAAPGRVLGWDANSFSSAAESQLVALTNQARTSRGLPALKVDSALTSIARWRSKDMIVRDYFSHDIPSPPGGRVFNEMDRRGYCYVLAGENIGWNNYPDDVATQQIQQMFMASSGHKANILGTRWDHIGVGAYKGPTGKKIWTVLFADKCGSAPAPRPTVKPTPKPAPKATPRPVVRATPKPVVRATPKPTPEPAPSAIGTPAPDLEFDSSPSGATPGGGPTGDDERPGPPAGTPPGLRVADPPVPSGLFETIVGGVAGQFFGS